jgi:carbamoyl-phosphate synthase large subunit
MPTTALVTCAGSMPAVGIINALKHQSEIPIRVIGADANPLAVGFQLADGHHTVPMASDPGFIPAVLEICKSEHVDILFPVIDEELLVFARSRERFQEAGIRVVSNDPEVVALAKDKYRTFEFCRREGIAVPDTYLAHELPAAERLEFPLIVKPRDGRGSADVFKARNRRELDFLLDKVPNPMVQRFVDGAEYTIDLLTDFHGNPLSVVPKIRLETKAGMQVKGRTVNDPRLIELGLEVIKKFALRPRGNVQCIIEGGTPFLIEVNPKFPASLPLTVASGVNAPLLLVKMHRGAAVEPMIGRFRDGLVMLRCWQAFFIEPTRAQQPHLRRRRSERTQPTGASGPVVRRP